MYLKVSEPKFCLFSPCKVLSCQWKHSLVTMAASTSLYTVLSSVVWQYFDKMLHSAKPNTQPFPKAEAIVVIVLPVQTKNLYLHLKIMIIIINICKY